MIDSRAALEAVIRHAEDCEDDYDEIAPTVRALEACGDATLVPRLREALDQFLDNEDFYGRDLMAGILAGIEGVAALPVLLRASARDCGDDQDGLSTEITELLVAHRAAGRSVAIEFARADTPELRRTGLWALGFVSEPEDVEVLAAAAADTDPGIRSLAVGSVPDPANDDRSFGILVHASSDLDAQVRAAAVSRLGYSRRADAVAPLVTRTGDHVARIRAGAAYALGRLGDAEATPALRRLLDDPDRGVRERAVDTLGSIGGPAAVDALLTLAANEDRQLRPEAAEALAKAVDSDPRVPSELTRLVRDDDPAVRAAILSGLAGTGDGSGRWGHILTDLADDPDVTVRERVAVVVRLLAPELAAGILRRYADAPEERLRRLASTELARLAGGQP